ncbi:MAG: YeeE/YedE family protein [Pseudobdellovibrio sp.]|nr:YeeE/YedE family protein [Pseudobdellovibrio sp.]
MKNNLSALLVGFIFSLGLGLSGMTDPEKIKGFLNIFGSWDPSLIFVMVGAIGVHLLTYQIIRQRKSPLFSTHWHVPQKTEITKSLVIGAVLFGVGWGLAGFCPGPAITSLTTLNSTVWVFVLFMILGMLLFKLIDKELKLNR